MNSELKPRIRFKGFTDDWEQRKLEDFGSFTGGTSIESDFEENGRYKVISIGSYSEASKYNDQGIRCRLSEKTVNKILNKDDLTMILNDKTASGNIIGRVLIIDKSGEYVYNQRTERIEPDIQNYYPEFLYHMLNAPNIRKKIIKQSQGNTQIFVNWTGIQKLEYLVPKIDEQINLAKLIGKLDNLITLHQHKCEKLMELKKSLLKKMFPQNNSVIPEIRFKGFTDDWEQRRFEDWGTLYYGHSCPKWSVTENSTIPCIRYGELYTKFGEKINEVYSYTNINPDKLRFSKGTEVLIPRVGEDPMDYTHCTWLSLKDVAIGEMISVFNTNQNPLFSAIMFNATLQKEFAIRVEGSSVTNLYYEKLKDINIKYPKTVEQEKISCLFDNLNNLITLHQRKNDKLNKIKQSLLKDMFV